MVKVALSPVAIGALRILRSWYGRTPVLLGPLPAMLTAADAPTMLLNELPGEQWAVVVDVVEPSNTVDGELVLRLMELGFVPGERLRVVAAGEPGREPLAVRLGHTTFALRRHEASFILVSPLT